MAEGDHFSAVLYDAKEQLVSRIPTALIAAYMATEYRAVSENGDIILRVGEPLAELAGLFARRGQRAAVFITAENPFSHANLRNFWLTGDSQGGGNLTQWRGDTGDRRHGESHWLAGRFWRRGTAVWGFWTARRPAHARG